MEGTALGVTSPPETATGAVLPAVPTAAPEVDAPKGATGPKKKRARNAQERERDAEWHKEDRLLKRLKRERERAELLAELRQAGVSLERDVKGAMSAAQAQEAPAPVAGASVPVAVPVAPVEATRPGWPTGEAIASAQAMAELGTQLTMAVYAALGHAKVFEQKVPTRVRQADGTSVLEEAPFHEVFARRLAPVLAQLGAKMETSPTAEFLGTCGPVLIAPFAPKLLAVGLSKLGPTLKSVGLDLSAFLPGEASAP